MAAVGAAGKEPTRKFPTQAVRGEREQGVEGGDRRARMRKETRRRQTISTSPLSNMRGYVTEKIRYLPWLLKPAYRDMDEKAGAHVSSCNTEEPPLVRAEESPLPKQHEEIEWNAGNGPNEPYLLTFPVLPPSEI